MARVMEIVHEEDAGMIGKRAAQMILGKAREIAGAKGKAIIALPGGRSIAGIIEEFNNSEDDIWKKIHVFMVDERLVPIEDPESNFKLLLDSFAQNLIDKGILPKENLHPFVMDSNKEDFGTKDYYSELERHGGKYDIVLLSAGEDGHIGGLYPNHSILSKRGLAYIAMDDSPKPPKERMTSSVELVASASYAVLLFIGDAKSEALEAFNNPKIGILDCPAKLVLWIKEAVVFTDLEQ